MAAGARRSDDVDTEVRQRLADGDTPGAVACAIEAYGPEVLGWLSTVLGDDDADDVFAQVSEELLSDLPSFRWECALRTWIYRLGRYRMIAWRKDPRRRPGRHVPLSRSPELQAAAAKARTTTVGWRRTDVKQGVARLRERLDPDDQTLLILRIDRDLSWREVAEIMGAGEAALRKRFERVKDRLRAMAKAEKLL
jgi:RNA polymerase sigma-70 factor (ECF subfamily)